jgi:hypothetical protein
MNNEALRQIVAGYLMHCRTENERFEALGQEGGSDTSR